MTRFKLVSAGAIAAVGLMLSSGDVKAQFVPGFTFGGTTVTPTGGVASYQRSVDPFWGSQSFQRSYFNPWSGVQIQSRVASGPFGNSAVVQTYAPWTGPTYAYQYSYYPQPVYFGPRSYNPYGVAGPIRPDLFRYTTSYFR